MFEVEAQPIKSKETTSIKDKIPSNIKKIGAIAKWKQGYKGKGVVVAILDSGCDTNHTDLKERVIDGVNFTNEFNSDPNNYEDMHGHGTHVAGTLAGSLNGQGIVGVAPEVKLLIVKILDKNGFGSLQELIEGIDYTINWKGDNDERVNIISLSLGMKEESNKLRRIVEKAKEKGIFIIAAAGNDGDGDTTTDECHFPACYSTPIVVGALDEKDRIAYFSNTNQFVDIYAPGVNIYSSYLNGNHVALSGTSMAAPHVTGAIAILIQEFREMHSREPSYEEIEKALLKNSTMIDVKDKIRILDLK